MRRLLPERVPLPHAIRRHLDGNPYWEPTLSLSDDCARVAQHPARKPVLGSGMWIIYILAAVGGLALLALAAAGLAALAGTRRRVPYHDSDGFPHE